MVTRYIGSGSIVLAVFLVTIGIWMFIDPVLKGYSQFNAGGLFFMVMGAALVFNFKKIVFKKEEIHIKQLITGRKTIISKKEILQVNVDIKNSGSYRNRHALLKIQFKTFKSDLILPSTPLILDFMKEHYSKLINEQIHV